MITVLVTTINDEDFVHVQPDANLIILYFINKNFIFKYYCLLFYT